MEWYYASNGQQKGPVSQEQLKELFQKGEVKSSDLVWNESMTDWVPFGNVPALSEGGTASSGTASSGTASSGTASSGAASSGAAADPAPAAAQVPAAASTVTAAASSPAPPAAGADIPTYLWQSIVCMVLCCLPLAIPALIFSTKVKPAVEMGKLDEALDASKKAKMWCWIAFGVGLVVQVLYLGLIAIGAMAEAGAM